MTLAPFDPTLSVLTALIGVTAICGFVVGFGIYRSSLAVPVIVTLPGGDGG
jgi:hypothetical protein